MAVASHKEVMDIDWPGMNWSDGCDEACLKAQMDNYRDKACGKGENPELNYVEIIKTNEED